MAHQSLALQPRIRKVTCLKYFTLFPRLPQELRLKIWKATAFIPRIIPVYTEQLGVMPITSEEIFKYFSSVPPPAMLQVCHEGRQEGKKFYRAEFGVKFHAPGIGTWIDPKIYINFEVDIIMPKDRYTQGSFEDFCKRKIQHLLISVPPFDDPAHLPYCFIQEPVFDFLRIKTLTICHQTHFHSGVPIDLEAPYIDETVDSSTLNARDALDGLVWARDAIKRVIKIRQEEIADRVKRNKEDKERGGLGSEETADEILNGAWKAPEVRIMNLVQQRPVGWPVHGRYVLGIPQFQPDNY